MSEQFIVVGVDESEVAADAARWAAEEADRRHCELRLVHAYTLPAIAGYPEFSSEADDLPDVMRRLGEDLVGRLIGELRRSHPGLVISSRVLYARPPTALRSESAGALVTVVGSGGEGRLEGVLLGSVALAVMSTCPAPVAVVRRDHPGRPGGPVVVGVDGAGTCEAAVAFAFEAASIRQTELVAVGVWDDIVVPGSRHLQNPLIDPERIEKQERSRLAERVAHWADRFPDVKVRQVLERGRAVVRLLEQAEPAQLVVVGSHGRGGFTGMLIGSTSQSLVVHSAAPVVVVRDPSRS